jgi:hypothetical protein
MEMDTDNNKLEKNTDSNMDELKIQILENESANKK